MYLLIRSRNKERGCSAICDCDGGEEGGEDEEEEGDNDSRPTPSAKDCEKRC